MCVVYNRLSVDVRRSDAISLLEGQLERVTARDLTEAGRRYRDILTMGDRPTEMRETEREMRERGSSEREMRETESSEREGGRAQQSLHDSSQSLSFSVHISPRSHSLPQSNNVHVTVFVPAIHYTHSVNLVHEMEKFVSEFQTISRAVMESFSSAAVGVAKGLVNEKTQFAETLSTSLGPRSMHLSTFRSTSLGAHSMQLSTFHPTEGLDIETTDGPLEWAPHDHLYVDILVQSPVITLPSSLHGDKCLVAYLGEISVKNEFGHGNLTDSLSTSMEALLCEREILTIRIDRMSLHATHDVGSRQLLVARGGRGSEGRWWKVLDETSVVVKVDRRIGGGSEGEKEVRPKKEEIRSETEFELNSDPLSERDTLFSEQATPQVAIGNPQTAVGSLPDVVVMGEICHPLLITLPKEVFDQIRVTLKHGIYRPTTSGGRRRRKQAKENEKVSSLSNSQYGVSSQSVTSSQSSQGVANEASQGSRGRDESPQSVTVNFSLPRLSLQLKHTIDTREKDLVYVSFEEFTAECVRSEQHITSLELALKSIIIEDLIQEKESEYRYILASSVKPFTGISPLRSGSSLGLQRISISPSQLSHPLLFPLSHLMSSTPRVAPPLATDSPLRSFTPHNDRGEETSQTGLRHQHPGQHHSSLSYPETGLTTPKTGLTTPKTGLRVPTVATSDRMREKEANVSFVINDDEECEITGSTLREDSGGHRGDGFHGNLSGNGEGLLSIKATFVDKRHREFSRKYNSVSCTRTHSLTHSLSHTLTHACTSTTT